jgi:hypothetical protein
VAKPRFNNLEFAGVDLIGFYNTVDTNQVYLIFKGPKMIFKQFLGALALKLRVALCFLRGDFIK